MMLCSLIFTYIQSLVPAIRVLANTTVSTYVTYVDNAKQETLGNENTGYYINVSVSSLNENYVEPYVDIKVKKEFFEKPESISSADSVKSMEVIDSETDYTIRLKFHQLSGGVTVAIPFTLTLKNGKFIKGQTYDIDQVFYQSDGTAVSTHKDTFTVGINSPVVKNVGIYPFVTTHTLKEDQLDSTKTKVANDYIINQSFHIVLPKTGQDKRPVKLVVSVPDSFSWDSQLANNGAWTYDAISKTLSRVVGVDNSNKDVSFDAKLANHPVGQDVKFIASLAYQNEDNSKEKISTPNATYTHKFKVFDLNNYTFGISKIQAGEQEKLYAPGDFDDRVEWITNLSITDKLKDVPIGTELTFQKISDLNDSQNVNPFNYLGIKFFTTQMASGIFDEVNFAKLSRNKLIGTLPDGSIEEVMTNLQLHTSEPAEYIKLPNKPYKKLELMFDEPVSAKITTHNPMQFLTIKHDTKFSDVGLQKLKEYYDVKSNLKNLYRVYNRAQIDDRTTDGRVTGYIEIKAAAAYVYQLKNNVNVTGGNGSNLAFNDSTVGVRSRLNIENFSPYEKNLENGKWILLAPAGLEFTGEIDTTSGTSSDGTFKLSSDYETIYNYKNTGKIAYIYDIISSKIDALDKKANPNKYNVDNQKVLNANFKPTKELLEGEHTIEVYVTYDNNTTFDNKFILGKDPDTLDNDSDGDTTELLASADVKFSYAPPKELIVTKRSKLAGSDDKTYAQGTFVDGTGTVTYRISAFNNTDYPISDVTFIDVLPYENDLSIVSNAKGEYKPRQSGYSIGLLSALQVPSGYTVYYSTDNPKQTLEENLNSTWKTANDFGDYSTVKMIKITMDKGKSLPSKTAEHFTFDVKLPNSKDVGHNKKAVNSVANYTGTNASAAVESLKNVLTIPTYNIDGIAYYDANKDGVFQEDESLAQGRKVMLYRIENGTETLIAETTTNKDGYYTFDGHIQLRGDYRISLELVATDVVSPKVATTSTIKGNDINEAGKADKTVSPNLQKVRVNMALQGEVGKVTVRHVLKETQEELAPSTSQSGVVGTDYTTMPVDNMELYEVISTELPANQNGKYTSGEQIVTFVYQRKNAGAVTVKHLYDGTEDKSAQVILDGTNKLGTPYTTESKETEDYELINEPMNKNGIFMQEAQEVIYNYRRKNAGSVTVRHFYDDVEDENVRTILDGTNKSGEPYTTESKVRPDYELISTPTNQNGTFTQEAQEVIYRYQRKNAGNVTVKYLYDGEEDQNVRVVLDGTHKLGAPYTTTGNEKEFYELTRMPDNQNGKFQEDEQEVVYRYRRKNAGNVTVKYLFDGKEDESLRMVLDGLGQLGKEYMTQSKPKENYELINLPDNKNGQFTTQAQEVVYEYRRKDAGDIIVKYIYDDTEDINERVTLQGTNQLGKEYATQEKPRENYDLVNVKGNRNGTYTTQAQEVVYEYRRKAAGTVTVKHVYDGVEDTQAQEVLEGSNKLGSPYTTQPKVKEFYELVKEPANKDGMFTANPQEVVYEYVRQDAGDITVKYFYDNEEDTNLREVLSGKNKRGTKYTTSTKKRENFTLIDLVGEQSGTFTEQAQEIIYKYRRFSGGDVIVKYIYDGEQDDEATEVLSGLNKLGLAYTTQSKEKQNFVLTQVPTNQNGIYKNEDQEVVYEYVRQDAGDVIVKYFYDDIEDEQAREILKGTHKLGLTYVVSAKDKENYELVEEPKSNLGVFTGDSQEVVYKYRRQNASSVTVKYIYDDIEDEKARMILDGANKLGLSYMTQGKDKENYELINVPNNQNGTYTEQAQEVVYEYRRKNAGNVTVKYTYDGKEDEDARETLNGMNKLGSPYTTKAKDKENFELVKIPANQNGTYTDQAQEVVYEYRRKNAGDVIVKYVYDGVEDEDARVVVSGNNRLGVTYKTNGRDKENYEFVRVVGNANGAFTTEKQEIVYEYRRKDAENVTVKYVYDNVEDDSVRETLSGKNKLGLSYVTQGKDKEHYQLVKVSGEPNGTYTDYVQEVIYEYRRQDAGNVTVKYMYDGHEDTSAQETLNGTNQLGLPYMTNGKNKENYELVKIVGEPNGTFTSQAQEVIYEYHRQNAGHITVKYVYDGLEDKDAQEVLEGINKLGTSYTTESKDKDHFELVEIPANQNGIFTSQEQEVIYRYRRQDAADVIVKYMYDGVEDKEAQVTLNGANQLGASYTTQGKNKANYELISIPANQNGTFTSQEQEVIYEYRRKDAGNVVITYTYDGVEDETARITLDGTNKLGTSYTSEPKDRENYELIEMPAKRNGMYTEEEQEVVYAYRRQNAGNVVITYTYDGVEDETARIILDGTNKLGTSYTSEPKDRENYELIEMPAKRNGVYTEEAQEIVYAYRRKDAGDITVVVKDTDGNVLADSKVLVGKNQLGQKYTVVPEQIDGYELVSVSGQQDGTFTSETQTVEFIYHKIEVSKKANEILPYTGSQTTLHVLWSVIFILLGVLTGIKTKRDN